MIWGLCAAAAAATAQSAYADMRFKQQLWLAQKQNCAGCGANDLTNWRCNYCGRRVGEQ